MPSAMGSADACIRGAAFAVSAAGGAGRAFDSAGKSAVVGDLFRIFAVTRREEAGFHWVTIPENVELGGNEAFDPVKMAELYDVGYRNALAGPQWSTQPPGLRDRSSTP